jgi:hypothetical protein
MSQNVAEKRYDCSRLLCRPIPQLLQNLLTERFGSVSPARATIFSKITAVKGLSASQFMSRHLQISLKAVRIVSVRGWDHADVFREGHEWYGNTG